MNAHATFDRDGKPIRELPEAIEAEQALLGAIMLNADAYHAAAERVQPAHFVEPIHRAIFEAAADLIRQGKAANPVTVKAFLRPDPVGSLSPSQYLARLITNAVTVANAPDFADAIRVAALKRELIGAGQHLEDAGFGVGSDVTLLEEIEAVQARVAEIVAGLSGREHVEGADMASRYLARLTQRPGEAQGHGVPMCLPELETVLSEKAFQAKRLYGLLSSSGEGKTSLTLQIIYHALKHGHPVLFLSYDQTHEECLGQMAAQQLGIELRRQQRRELSDREIEQCYGFACEVGRMPFEVIDCTNENADRLASYATTFIKRRGNGRTPLVVIDHIGTIRPDDARADEGTKARTIAQRLKALAKATGAAVLVLQQRSSAGMKRPNPRPIGSDLFGGEAAKQPFDAIAYLYRAEKYRKEQLAVAANERDRIAIEERFPLDKVEGKAEIGALKVRFGDVSIRRKVDFEASLTRYKSQRQDVGELPL